MSEIADRYRRRADAFEQKVAGVTPEQWPNQSPCEDWTARDVVGHVVDMHTAMLQPLDRQPRPGPSVDADPVVAFRNARADIEAVLADPTLAATECNTPMGPATAADHIDQVASEDLVVHGWDLARATGQDDTIDPDEVARMWPVAQAMDERMRIPNAFGPGIVVFGPEVPVPDSAPLQDRLLGLLGRDPR